MSVAISAEIIVADRSVEPAPATLANVVPITRTSPAAPKRKRLSFLSALIDVGAEIGSLCMESARAFAVSRTHDARADGRVATIARIAARGAAESAIFGCGHEPHFQQIVTQANLYVIDDDQEDGWVARGAAAVIRIREIARGMCRALTRELSKRGWTGGPT